MRDDFPAVQARAPDVAGCHPADRPNWLGSALLRFQINVRASAILGLVGGGGIGHDLKHAMQWGQGRFDEVEVIFPLLFASILLIDRISDHYRHKLVKGHRAMTMTALSPALADTITKGFATKRRMAFAVPAVILACLVCAAISFDIVGSVHRPF